MKKLKVPFLSILFLIVAGCAQQGAPTGGPKDETPPKLLNAVPKNYSTNFSSKKIQITFDEFLDMGNFNQELVVSPPMNEKPIIKLRNKTLIIEFEEDLKENITYTFNFGEGIKDLNEKNILMNFEYVFSTGDYLDSLSVKGTLRNAFDLSIPEKPLSIMLYKDLNDSLPLKDIPYYVGRADEKGNYAVNNLRPDVYKLFVLKDGNNNFLFDLPTEEIAFLDSSLLVDAVYFKSILLASGKYDSAAFEPDTIPLAIDTTGLSADTIAMMLDSLEAGKPDINSVYLDLYMFKEDPENQYITEFKRKERRKIELLFNLPLTEQFSYEPLFPAGLTREGFVEEFGKKRDSLVLWMGDTVVAAFDTIDLKMTYPGKDSTGAEVLVHDTLSFIFREPAKKEKTKKEGEKEAEKLNVSTIKTNGKQNLNRRLDFSLNYPLASIDHSKFDLFVIPDSVEIPMEVFPESDSLNIRKASLSVTWQEDTRYRMVLYPGTLVDIYGATHDTIDVIFKTKTVADYGKILLTLTHVEEQIVIQLFKKDVLIREKSISEEGLYEFDFLEPATYRIKYIFDRNGNGKWDTGKYLEKRQPERVEFLPKDITVRANWEHDAEYEMGSNLSAPVVEKAETSDKSKSEEKRNETRERDVITPMQNTMPGSNRPNINRDGLER